MTLTVREVLDRLKALRTLDLRVRQCDTDLAAGPASVSEHGTAVAGLQAQIKALDDRAKVLRAQIKLRENELKGHEQKVAKFKEQSGQVKNNKEFMAFRAEIANAQADGDRLQGEILKILDVVQQADAKMAELGALRAAAQKKHDEAKARVDGELSGVKAERASLLKKRPAHFADVPPEILEVYERAHKGRGDPLAHVENDYCTGCGERQTRNDLYAIENATRVVSCKSCNRVLVAP